MSFPCEQLLRYAAFGHIPVGFGDWHGFVFGLDGRLYAPGQSVGFSAGEISGFYLTMAQAGKVPGLLAELARIERSLIFHERQTRENSSMGFMRGLVEVLTE